MMKQVLRSYCSVLHPRNLMLFTKTERVIGLLYILFLFPYWLNMFEEEYRLYWLREIILIPFFILFWVERMSPSMISKAFYLCPMQDKERKKYIQLLLYVRISVPVLAAVVCGIWWSLVSKAGWLEVLCIVYSYLNLCIAYCVKNVWKDTQSARNSTVGIADDAVQFVWKDAQSTWNIIGRIASFSALFFIVSQENFSYHMELVTGVVIGLCMILAFFCSIMILVKQYRDCIENACDYEVHFGITKQIHHF